MSIQNNAVTEEQVVRFLEGSDPQKYIVAVEANYHSQNVTLVINDPDSGKRLETHKYKPFLWFKEEVISMLYNGKRIDLINAKNRYKVEVKSLRISDNNGNIPQRMQNGYKYIAKCNGSYNDLITFFKVGGIDIFDSEKSKLFVAFNPDEQFLIQSGKRLFKGIDDYNDLHRLQFDLETEGLLPSKHAVFQIGVRTNRGFERVLEISGSTPQERRDSEREIIKQFFEIINELKPDVIAGYNSENFDWAFLHERCQRLSINIKDIAITLNSSSKIRRKSASLKLGGERENYEQTIMFGYNILDISHAVRRAMAINSEIKSWGLKYITQFSDIAKPNRVYVKGDKINSTWLDSVNQYAFNEKNGNWYKISEKNPLKDGYDIVSGSFIVQRYLCDDLWETEQIDNIYNQASFLISKLIPTNYMRSSTMGTAGQWKLIMSAWSYEQGLAIPENQKKKDFTGGLSRLLEVGYARNVVKLDYAALYPKNELTHDIFPDLDISGAMKIMLAYIVDTRDKFKFLAEKEKKSKKRLEAEIKSNHLSLMADELAELKQRADEHKKMASLYDKKQLPVKILANSWFGSYGAPYIFNWGDVDCAEETTCRGRQYLRLMVKHFTEKYGFRALVGDTDGFNFSFPDNINDIRYVAKGSHWKTTDDAGKELIGLDAVLAEFNENYMIGRMGLDIDDICNATINFSRKNYANDIGGKIKLVGNSIKSKRMPVYIEEFLGVAIRMLLNGDGHSFIKFYHDYVDKIYNHQIPLVKIASKAKIKSSINDYKNKCKKKNKRGAPMPRQAHMELAIKDGLDVTLGDVLYYVNTGNSKSQGDLKTIVKSKMNKKELERYIEKYGAPPKDEISIELNCSLINPSIVDRDFETIKELDVLKRDISELPEFDDRRKELENKISELNGSLYTDEYNVVKYLTAFNNKVKPLLVCFNPNMRDKILLDVVKIKTKEGGKVIITEKLSEKFFFTKSECELVSGMPFKETDQDSYAELMTMEDKEIKFWDRVNKIPNNMEPDEWYALLSDYKERMKTEKESGIMLEKERLDTIFKHLEVSDLAMILKDEIPTEIILIAPTIDDEGYLVSKKWEERLCHVDDIFKYENLAIERSKFYKDKNIENREDKYQIWLDSISENKLLGQTDLFGNSIEKEKTSATPIIISYNKQSKEVSENLETKKKNKSSDDEDDEDDEGEENIDDNDIILEDEFDDTFVERPDIDFHEEETQETEYIDDWPF
jgi:DNA polymerase elongation subunit (family B)